jgi:uncharacterized protein YcfJ
MMQTVQTTNKIHPLMAGAAASVMLVSLVGVAAMTGLLPDSHGEAKQVASAAPVVEKTVAPDQEARPAPQAAAKKAAVKPAVQHASAQRYAQAGNYQQPSYQQPTYQQPTYQPAPAQQPSYQQPAPQLSPVGIAAGAVLGGVLGNQVGGGNGRKLATVAGVLGGGYIGNEVAKRYGY